MAYILGDITTRRRGVRGMTWECGEGGAKARRKCGCKPKVSSVRAEPTSSSSAASYIEDHGGALTAVLWIPTPSLDLHSITPLLAYLSCSTAPLHPVPVARIARSSTAQLPARPLHSSSAHCAAPSLAHCAAIPFARLRSLTLAASPRAHPTPHRAIPSSVPFPRPPRIRRAYPVGAGEWGGEVPDTGG